MGTKNKITELTYTIEALADEVDHLDEIVKMKTTMNDELVAEVERLKGAMAMKQSRIAELITENDRLTSTYEPYYPPKVKKSLRTRLFKPSRYAGDVTLDYWPPSDWVRFSLKKWRPGQYLQLCVGPIRFEFYAN